MIFLHCVLQFITVPNLTYDYYILGILNPIQNELCAYEVLKAILSLKKKVQVVYNNVSQFHKNI